VPVDVVRQRALRSGFEQPRGSWKFAHADIVVRGCEVFGIAEAKKS